MRTRRSWTFEYQRKRVIRFCLGSSLLFSLVSLAFYTLARRVFSLGTLVRDERSYIYPTRLETRTKESSMCASHWVLLNLKAKWKWKLPFGSWGVIQLVGATPSGHICLAIWPRKSVHAGTRKMVNYAWAGWSQRKLWWRSVAVLTCKSIVKLGYRGERLIEPSSCWFPPKFPSG